MTHAASVAASFSLSTQPAASAGAENFDETQSDAKTQAALRSSSIVAAHRALL